MQECGTPNAKLGEYLEAAPPHNPLPPASRYSPCFLLVVPHSQYTISPVGQGLQGRGIFLHILVLHDIRMNICTNVLALAQKINGFMDVFRGPHDSFIISSLR